MSQVATQVRGILSSPAMSQQIQNALPRHLTPERMIRVAVTAIQKTPKLSECSVESLIACVVEASQLGLEPDGVQGKSYLVPYWNGKTKSMEAQLMVGYKGLIDLARRSGEIGAVNAEVVYEVDEFHVVKGLEPNITHIPKWDAEDQGELVAAYATAKLRSGETQFCVMSKRQIDKHRQRSKSSDRGPWDTDYEWMAKKTALRQLCKLLPSSVELDQAVAYDEKREAGVIQGDDFVEVTATQAITQPRRLDEIAAQKTEQTPDPETGEIPDPEFGAEDVK